MLWVKAFHIVFVAAWFAGLFYLPRIFVNLAMVPGDSHAERERLLLMAHKLHRFSSVLMAVALLLVAGTVGLHHMNRRLLRSFEELSNRRSHRWFRVYNESAVLLFTAIVVLVTVKPF